MKILIYKRTHRGDPNTSGVFGNEDCMGKVRNWDYDAVIGIGGKSAWKGHEGISLKVNWVGIGPKKREAKAKRGKEVEFDEFALFEDNGPNIERHFPNLYKHMYGDGKRFNMSSDLPSEVFQEVEQILNLAKGSTSQRFEIENYDEFEAGCMSDTLSWHGCHRGKNVEVAVEQSSCK